MCEEITPNVPEKSSKEPDAIEQFDSAIIIKELFDNISSTAADIVKYTSDKEAETSRYLSDSQTKTDERLFDTVDKLDKRNTMFKGIIAFIIIIGMFLLAWAGKLDDSFYIIMAIVATGVFGTVSTGVDMLTSKRNKR